MQEPIIHLFNKYKLDRTLIKQIVCGEKYVAILLTNGNIGICSTLKSNVEIKINDLKNIDLKNIEHRIVYNAYLNALLNYSNLYDKIVDIFDYQNFKAYTDIVMVGYFQSLINKFKKENISLSIYDKAIENYELSPINKMLDHCNKADAIILTGTTIFNQTFLNIVNNSGKTCDIFLLGPSNILHPDMLQYRNIKIVFGAIFEKNDQKILDLIKKGCGTKDFLPYMKKVYLLKD